MIDGFDVCSSICFDRFFFVDFLVRSDFDEIGICFEIKSIKVIVIRLNDLKTKKTFKCVDLCSKLRCCSCFVLISNDFYHFRCELTKKFAMDKRRFSSSNFSFCIASSRIQKLIRQTKDRRTLFQLVQEQKKKRLSIVDLLRKFDVRNGYCHRINVDSLRIDFYLCRFVKWGNSIEWSTKEIRFVLECLFNA